MEQWTEIQLKVNSADIDAACDIANMAVDYGIYIEDYTDLEQMAWEISHIDLIDEDLLAKDRSKAIIHLYIPDDQHPLETVTYLRERLSGAQIKNTIDTVSVENTDWLNRWKQYFQPIEIGSRLAVCPSWEQYENTENRCVLSIDPGAAFGTGTHETTNLCLTVLDRVVKGGETMLDIGCGSGILALSSLLLGCHSAVGVDIDPLAVKTAQQNAKQNHLDSQVRFICGDLTDRVQGTFDIICANIVADVIITLCDTVQNYMNDDTILVFSGIIDAREQDVTAKIQSTGLQIQERFEKKGWVALVCSKRS